MAEHELKTDPKPFMAVSNGDKRVEIRLNDREYKVGDVLLLRQTKHTGTEMRYIDPKPLEYTGRECRAKITHITKGYGLFDNFVALSIQTIW